MTRLEEVTYEKFGDGAERLLSARAIIPLVDKAHPKAGIKNWNIGFDPKQDIGFHSLGLLTGERAGITVVDIDRHDIDPPVEPNVKTAKGCHVYVPHHGESRKIGLLPGIDLIGTNGYAIFYGPGKTFTHPVLADPEIINSWITSLDEKSSISSCRDTEQGYWTGLENRVIEQGYCALLESEGYYLDKQAVSDQYVLTMVNVKEGSRNATLYRYTREMVRCGLDLGDLEQAAIDSGLDAYEVISTMQSAEAAVLLDPRKSVFDRVTFWLDNAIPLVSPVAHDVMREVARRAIETNDLAPFIPQQEIADRLTARGPDKVRDRSTISKILTLLDRQHGVIKVISLGFQPDGKRNPNAYRLCLGGTPVAEVDA